MMEVRKLTPAEIVKALDDGQLVDDGGILSQECKHCREPFPFDLENFAPRKENKRNFGLDPVCRACRAEERAAKRQKQKQMEAA